MGVRGGMGLGTGRHGQYQSRRAAVRLGRQQPGERGRGGRSVVGGFGGWGVAVRRLCALSGADAVRGCIRWACAAGPVQRGIPRQDESLLLARKSPYFRAGSRTAAVLYNVLFDTFFHDHLILSCFLRVSQGPERLQRLGPQRVGPRQQGERQGGRGVAGTAQPPSIVTLAPDVQGAARAVPYAVRRRGNWSSCCSCCHAPFCAPLPSLLPPPSSPSSCTPTTRVCSWAPTARWVWVCCRWRRSAGGTPSTCRGCTRWVSVYCCLGGRRGGNRVGDHRARGVGDGGEGNAATAFGGCTRWAYVAWRDGEECFLG